MTATLEKVESMPVRYSIADDAIAEMREQYFPLTADTKDGYEEVRIAIAKTRTLRGEIEERRVSLKADALAWGRKVDSEAKRLTGLLLEIEEPLKAKKLAVDDAKERARKAKEEEERRKVEAEIEAKREAERQRMAEEQARLAEERKKFEAERAAEAAKQKAERDRIEAEQRAERERLAAERAKVEAEQKAERDRIDAERRQMEAERARLAKEESERQAAILAEKEAAARAERERFAQEAAKKREEGLRPDVEKLATFAGVLRKIQLPDVESAEAKRLLGSCSFDLRAMAAKCEAFGK